MSDYKKITPEDIVADGLDTAIINGKTVRKGSIAAFLANLEIFENPKSSKLQKQTSFEMMQSLADTVITVGLHNHVIFKNPEVEKLLVDASTLSR